MSFFDQNGAGIARGASPLAIQTGSAAAGELRLCPIEPDWILEGAPTARAIGLTDAADGLLSTSIWDCSAGKFRWHFGCDEIVHVLEGEVHIQEPGAEHMLRPGDVAFFPAGSSSVWTVPRYVKKLAIHRGLPRPLLRRLRSRLGRLVRPGR